MEFKIIISIEAAADTEATYRYYEEQQADLGERFLNELIEYYEKLTLHPTHYSFVSADKTICALSLKIFPYKIIYQVEGIALYVYAIYHFSQHPDQFIKRL